MREKCDSTEWCYQTYQFLRLDGPQQSRDRLGLEGVRRSVPQPAPRQPRAGGGWRPGVPLIAGGRRDERGERRERVLPRVALVRRRRG